jgi:ribosomal protein S18 acetylase RimI-like enzyme
VRQQLERESASMQSADGASSTVRIEILTRARVEELAPLMDEGFGAKRCCCCFGTSMEDTSEWGLIPQLLKGYAKYPDEKIAVCGIAVEYPGAADPEAPGTPPGTIVGVCQLQMPGMPGDYELPAALSEELAPDEGHIERIAVSSQMRGRGIGTQLLDWAHATCRNWGRSAADGAAGPAAHTATEGVAPLLPAQARQQIRRVSLEVVHGNPAQR